MAKSKPSTMLKLLKTLIGVSVIVAASIGATLLYYDKTGLGLASAETPADAPAERKAVPLPAPIFIPLDPFTVTVRGESSQRILYVAITLRTADDASRRMIVEFMPEVRDRALRKLAEQQPDRVQTPEGRQALVASLSRTLQDPYLPHSKGPDITSVLFTAFVVQ
jgi:flagellar FliL protein